MSIFCKDFGFHLSKNKIIEVFKGVSKEQTSLELEQFEQVLPMIAVEFCKEKSREIKARLKEYKNVLEYPNDRDPNNRPIRDIVLNIEEIDLDPIKANQIPKNIPPTKRIE